MKRIYGLFAFFIIVGLCGAAAIDTGFGVKGVVGMSIASGDDWFDEVDYFGGNNLGIFTLGGGVFGDVKIGDRLAIGAEALFGNIGGKYEDYVGDTMKYTIPVIQVPLMLKYAFANKEKGGTYVYAGPNLYFVTGDFTATVNIDGDEASADGEVENTFAMGFVVGGADEYPFGPGFVVLDLRYARTLGEILNGEAYFNSFVLGLGYKFTLGE